MAHNTILPDTVITIEIMTDDGMMIEITDIEIAETTIEEIKEKTIEEIEEKTIEEIDDKMTDDDEGGFVHNGISSVGHL